MSGDHIFAQYLRTIGRGPTLSRPLDATEAYEAMRLILGGIASPVQIGAFLLLLRYRGETPDELAGFVRAARDQIGARAAGPTIDIDWPSYADRHRQQPWFVLAALLLAENGYKVLMHGIAGYDEGYAPTRPVFERLGLPICRSLDEAAAAIGRGGLAYIGLEHLCPPLSDLFALRPLLGLRSVVNTLARALNPLAAPYQLQGVFHPPYRSLQQQAAIRLGQPFAAIFKGGAGEAQRNPLKPCRVSLVHDGVASEEEWPALITDTAYNWRGEDLDPAAVIALWRGEREPAAPKAAITGTVALALRLTGRAADPMSAQRMAEDMWRARPRTKYVAAA